ncbi:MAG: hypothetical protein WKF35_08550 [Ferruginibacter sp.]
MDQRETFNNPEQLLTIVSTNYRQKLPSAFLIDNGGLERMEGIITAIEEGQNINKFKIIIAGKNEILLEQIIGINGIFRSDYSEC